MGWRYGPPLPVIELSLFPMEDPLTVAAVWGSLFPSGVASTQELSHEPTCQTGCSAPQGRFHHQSEQAFHLSRAWQCASFSPSRLWSERRPRIRPARGGTQQSTHSAVQEQPPKTPRTCPTQFLRRSCQKKGKRVVFGTEKGQSVTSTLTPGRLGVCRSLLSGQP